jgi:hypothetical protein
VSNLKTNTFWDATVYSAVMFRWNISPPSSEFRQESTSNMKKAAISRTLAFSFVYSSNLKMRAKHYTGFRFSFIGTRGTVSQKTPPFMGLYSMQNHKIFLSVVRFSRQLEDCKLMLLNFCALLMSPGLLAFFSVSFLLSLWNPRCITIDSLLEARKYF